MRTVLPIRFLLLLILLLASAACGSPTPEGPIPTPVELFAATLNPTRRASPTPRPIQSPTPRATLTLTPTTTSTPNPLQPTLYPADAPPQGTIAPDILTQVAPQVEVTLPPDSTLVGRSVEGRGIVARTFGRGSKPLLLIGGIHGGWEVNTVVLMNELITYFDENPDQIAPGLSLEIIPAANPDGLLRGRSPEGRLNANSVDLNRNWSCDWEAAATWQDRTVSGGEQPFSEPESAALADHILLTQPLAVIFYHSAAGGVFPGECEGDHGSQVFGHIYGEAAGYPSDGDWGYYTVTGDASNWVDLQSIPAITVELQTWTDTEFQRNLDGLMAVQCELARRLLDPATQRWAAAQCPGQ